MNEQHTLSATGDTDSDSIAAHFAHRATTFDSTPWAYDAVILSCFDSLISVSPTSRILDAGGGTGLLSAHFRERCKAAIILSLDLSFPMAQKALSKGISSCVADVCYLPLRSCSLDVVVLRQVLQYLQTPSAALQECYRVLRPGGQLLLGQFVPYDHSDQRWLKRILETWQPLKKHLPTSEDLRELLVDHRFRMQSTVQLDVFESLASWLDRHRVPANRRPSAFAMALSQRHHVTDRRRVLSRGDDILFSNLFHIIDARKPVEVETTER